MVTGRSKTCFSRCKKLRGCTITLQSYNQLTYNHHFKASACNLFDFSDQPIYNHHFMTDNLVNKVGECMREVIQQSFLLVALSAKRRLFKRMHLIMIGKMKIGIASIKKSCMKSLPWFRNNYAHSRGRSWYKCLCGS